MKPLIFALFSILCSGQGVLAPILAGAPSSAPAACGNGFLHCRSITWNHTQAGTADTANFVGLLNATESDWALVGSGGDVQHTVFQSGGSWTTAIPADFIFTIDAACTNPVAGWEFESYNVATGAMLAWINMGTLSHTTDTVIWACYDKASVTTQQATVSATWDSGYKAVYHFGISDLTIDSTSGAHTLTNTGGLSTGTGQIGSGGVFDAGKYLSVAGFSLGANVVTMEAWAFSSTMTAQNPGIFIEHSPVNGSWLLMDTSGTLLLRGVSGSDLTSSGTMSNSTWYSTGGSITGTSGAIYINASANTGTVTAFADASNAFNLGQYDGGSGGGFVGTLDEVRISNSARAASYFTARYNQEKTSQTMVTVGALN